MLASHATVKGLTQKNVHGRLETCSREPIKNTCATNVIAPPQALSSVVHCSLYAGALCSAGGTWALSTYPVSFDFVFDIESKAS